MNRINYLKEENWNWNLKDIKNYNSLDHLSSIICKNCFKFSINSKICKICDYILCINCLKNLINLRKNFCYNCKNKLRNYRALKRINNEIFKQIKINCILKEKGCSKENFKLSDLKFHLKNECKYFNINMYNINYNEKNQLLLKEYIEFDLILPNYIKENELKLFGSQKTKFIFEGNILKIFTPKIDDLYKPDLLYNPNHISLISKKNIIKEIYNNEDIYEGEKHNIIKNKFGKYFWKNKDYYEGYFKDNRFNGLGIYIYNDGRYYNGEWKNDDKSGYGIKKYNKGIFKGYFNKDVRNWIGRFDFNDESKDIFYGNYKKDMRDGYGVYYYNNSKKFHEGFFKNDLYDGLGIELFDCGIYLGNFKKDKMHGYGIFYFKNGEIYKGEFKNSQKSGYGIFINKNESIYLGYWKKDNMHGKGKLIHKNGKMKEGNWKNNYFLND